MKLSLVVPCFNEEKVIENFHEKVRDILLKHEIDYELLFIDDGSKDKTLMKIKTLSQIDKNIKYISFSRNFGKESAMLAGLTYSSGDAVVIIDVDLQHPPELIPKMVEIYQNGFDQVIAKRNRIGEKRFRSLISILYYKIINRLIDVELANGIGDFRLLSRKAVNSILTLREYNRFSKGLFSWIGFKEFILEYDNVTRKKGESKWTFRSLLNYGIDGVISFNNKPLRISIYLGIIITIINIIYILYMFIKTIVYGIDVPGYFTIISAILFFGGIQLLFLGVIGEYIGRIYYETKRRPHFIVSENNISEEKRRNGHEYVSIGSHSIYNRRFN